jgi:hypothetical protein
MCDLPFLCDLVRMSLMKPAVPQGHSRSASGCAARQPEGLTLAQEPLEDALGIGRRAVQPLGEGVERRGQRLIVRDAQRAPAEGVKAGVRRRSSYRSACSSRTGKGPALGRAAGTHRSEPAATQTSAGRRGDGKTRKGSARRRRTRLPSGRRRTKLAEERMRKSRLSAAGGAVERGVTHRA